MMTVFNPKFCQDHNLPFFSLDHHVHAIMKLAPICYVALFVAQTFLDLTTNILGEFSGQLSDACLEIRLHIWIEASHTQQSHTGSCLFD